MENFIREIPLANGLTVSFFQQTRRYFGDYHLVKLEIVCKVPLLADYFSNKGEFAAAGSLLGEEVLYRRCVEQMGVPSAEVELVLNRLTADFENTALPYVASPAFPRKLVAAELAKRGKRMPHPPARRGQP